MEYLDICDDQGLPTGRREERSLVHSLGLRHRTAHVWILRQRECRWQVLLQKRSREKDSFPGMYDTSSAGHIPAGQEPLASALRELEEELGIRARAEELEPVGSIHICYQKEFYGRLFKDDEHCSVFLLRRDLEPEELRFQPGEVEGAMWYGLEELWRNIDHSRDRICAPKESLALLIKHLALSP